MKFTALLLFMVAIATASSLSLQEIRSLYLKSHKDEACCSELLKKLQNIDPLKEPVAAGYKGCATMMMANYTYNPARKLSAFYEGRDLLENVIQKNSENPELRYLRYTIQTNVPSFIGYNKAIESDKKFLIAQVNNLSDAALKKMIADYLRHSERVTGEEKNKLP